MKNLQPIINCIRAELDAEQATLLLYSGANSDRLAQLFVSGTEPPAPEFTNLEAAEHLINGALSSRKVESFASSDPQCRLICIPVSANQQPLTEQAAERRSHPVNEPGFWIGLRGGVDEHVLQSRYQWLQATVRLAAELFALRSWRADPDTGLPDRGEYERALAQYLTISNSPVNETGMPVSVLLIAPKVLTDEHLPMLLDQASKRAQRVLRDSDQLYRYTNTALALPLLGVDENGLQALAQKLLGSINRLGDSPADLRWAIAAVHFTEHQTVGLRTIECARLVDRTLRRCVVESGDRTLVLNSTEALASVAEEPLHGIFTADPVRDYRNMQLLWDAVEQLSNLTSAAELAINIVQLTSTALDAPVSLYEMQPDQPQTTPAALQTLNSRGDLPDDEASLRQLAIDSVNGQRPGRCHINDTLCYAFPAQGTLTAALVLMIADRTAAITQSDERLLESLVRQLANAVARLKIDEQEKGLRESETQELRQRVNALAQSNQSPVPKYQSARMQAVVAQADLWAATHETLLITGESGAGKEIMATRLHQQSLRATAPMVTVDCAAIPGTLLEAELFGRVKGAYTGADSASEGYVRKAEGGTLFLDEIGELPIDVQAKLLRFVQEKQISPVGSTDMHRIDVRIIAATNRDLATEAAAGRFRSDLMYRLQVLEIKLPPLRERREDIDALAEFFLDSYNQQYERSCQLTDAAREQLRSYGWPGNVRELKHSMLKACLECTDNQIEPADIGFAAPMVSTNPPPSSALVAVAPVTANPMATDSLRNKPFLAPRSTAELWQDLETSLHSCCQAAVEGDLRLPIGTWITEALIRAANERANGVAKHGAKTLQLPESTYRRQLERIRQSDQSGLAVLHPLFQPNISIINSLLAASLAEKGAEQSANPQQISLVDQTRDLLLGIVDALLPDQSSFGAALMGVTAPTYRRHLKAHRSTKVSMERNW
ncbi:MAG: sigma 54-interacting transcriptional regulator [Pseudomonadales bacterium]